MERKDITTLVSHYIPNEQIYRFDFPVRILNKYNGPDDLDTTIDDELLYVIIKPLLDNEIEYNYKLEWSTEHTNPWFHFLSIILMVNENKFKPDLLIKNLQENNMCEGLTLKKECSDGRLETIFNSAL